MLSSTKRAEVALVSVFSGVILIFFLVYCIVDFRDARSDNLLNLQNQTIGMVSWVDRNLDLTKLAMHAVAEGAPSDCQQEEISSIVGRLLRTVAVEEIEVRKHGSTVCVWKPPVDAFFSSGFCQSPRSENTVVLVSAEGGNGVVAVAHADTRCLLTPFLVSQRDARTEVHLAAGFDDETGGRPVRRVVAFPETSWWDAHAEVAVHSAAWPVSVGVSVPETVLLEAWAQRLPVHIGLFAVLGTVCWFGPIAMMRRRISISGQVRGALRRSEFFLLYLPTVEIESGEWVGVEALLRWRTRQFGTLPPSAFIPWLEKSTLIHDTTNWVMTQAAKDLKRLRETNDNIYVGINVPPSQLADERLLDAALTAFGGDGSALNRVMFELTEREMVDYNSAVVQDVVNRLRAHGALIALDDFGVGFSNIACLRSIRVDVIKVDKSFTQALGAQDFGSASQNPALMDMVVKIAREFDVRVIAEGIETKSQLADLQSLGIRLAQGFLFSRPVELDAVVSHIKERQMMAEAS